MQALVELIAGFIAMLAAVALSQFGVDLNARQKPDREVHRVVDCGETPSQDVQTLTMSASSHDC